MDRRLFSRKLLTAKPVDGPNAGQLIQALEDAFRSHELHTLVHDRFKRVRENP